MRNNGGIFVYQQIAKTKAEWLEENPIVAERVIVFETDTRMMRMGDGKTHYSDLAYRLSQGLSPRVNMETENWEIYNVETEVWDNTGLRAYPGSAPRLDEATNLWEVWDDEQRAYVKTAFQCGSAYDLLVKYGDYKGTMADFCRQLDNFTRYGEQQVGQLTNAGAGYNSFTFAQEFSEEVYVTLTPVNCNCYAVVRNITKQGFYYCLYTPDGNTTSNNELANWNACTVSELNLARAMAKAVGLNPFDYDNLTQLFASHAAEVVTNDAALRMINNSSMASGRYLCHLAGLNPDGYVNVFSIAKDITAMNTVCQNEACISFIDTSPASKDSIKLSDIGTTKYAATLAGLDCALYDNMAAVIASSTAMAAVIASSTAMAAVAASSTAMAAVAASSTAMAAVIASSTAMAAVIASSTAMAAVIASSTAMAAVIASSTAMAAVIASSTAMAAVIASSTAMAAVAKSTLSLRDFNAAIWRDGLDEAIEKTLTSAPVSVFTKSANYSNSTLVGDISTPISSPFTTKPGKIFILKYTTDSDNEVLTINADGFSQSGTNGNGSGGTFPGIIGYYDNERTLYRRVYFGRVEFIASAFGAWGDIYTAI